MDNYAVPRSVLASHITQRNEDFTASETITESGRHDRQYANLANISYTSEQGSTATGQHMPLAEYTHPTAVTETHYQGTRIGPPGNGRGLPESGMGNKTKCLFAVVFMLILITLVIAIGGLGIGILSFLRSRTLEMPTVVNSTTA